jgi:hypothetical protein
LEAEVGLARRGEPPSPKDDRELVAFTTGDSELDHFLDAYPGRGGGKGMSWTSRRDGSVPSDERKRAPPWTPPRGRGSWTVHARPLPTQTPSSPSSPTTSRPPSTASIITPIPPYSWQSEKRVGRVGGTGVSLLTRGRGLRRGRRRGGESSTMSTSRPLPTQTPSSPSSPTTSRPPSTASIITRDVVGEEGDEGVCVGSGLDVDIVEELLCGPCVGS